LPPGWEKHEDGEGAYYWHVKSGTIQRERPEGGKSDEEDMEAAAVREVDLIAAS
jgi:amyloid beta (A4) precursor protein-binding family B protein 2 (Fe65-like)